MHIQRRVGSKAAAREGCGKAKRRTDIVSLWPVAAAGSLLLQYDCVTFLSYLEVLKEGEASPAAAAGPAYRPRLCAVLSATPSALLSQLCLANCTDCA